MKVAVSGSTGLIGSALCERLSSSGHDVFRLVRPTSQGERQPGDILWDPTVGLADPQQLNDFSAVVHLAGRSIASARWSPAEKQAIRDSRILATERLVEQIGTLDIPPPIFLGASAIGIYGDCNSRAVDEHAPAGDDFLAAVATDWEAVCDGLRQRGLRVAHPRFGIVLSKSGGALTKMLPLFRRWMGGRLGSGDQFWSWIALEDCVSALVWLLENPEARGPYNLTAPSPATNSEFTRALAQALHRPALIPAPAFVLRLALGEMADALLLASCRVMPQRLLEGGFEFQFPQLKNFLEHELHGRTT